MLKSFTEVLFMDEILDFVCFFLFDFFDFLFKKAFIEKTTFGINIFFIILYISLWDITTIVYIYDFCTYFSKKKIICFFFFLAKNKMNKRNAYVRF